MINWIKKKIANRQPEKQIWDWLDKNPEYTITFTNHIVELCDIDNYSIKEYLITGMRSRYWDSDIARRLDHMKQAIWFLRLNADGEEK